MEWHTSKTRSKVWDKTGGRCWYCGTPTNPWRTFCVDHQIPRRDGIDNRLENLVPCCRQCNLRKGKKTVEQFRQEISTYHGLATTGAFAEWRVQTFGHGGTVTRLVFYFETLQNVDEEILKQGADELFYFNDPTYFSDRQTARFLSWSRFGSY